jgi:hypothetical protein
MLPISLRAHCLVALVSDPLPDIRNFSALYPVPAADSTKFRRVSGEAWLLGMLFIVRPSDETWLEGGDHTADCFLQQYLQYLLTMYDRDIVQPGLVRLQFRRKIEVVRFPSAVASDGYYQ